MTIVHLTISARDPVVARDGRPFGENQGQRMRSLPWPLPSVVAGSFRTALVKAGSGDFSGDIPGKLREILVSGVFPVHDGKMYLPAPSDAVAQPHESGPGIKALHRTVPYHHEGTCDFPNDAPLWPVMLPEAAGDFKPAELPAWWPQDKYAEWLTSEKLHYAADWLEPGFLGHPTQCTRDHVSLDADRGAADEGKIFVTSGLNLTHLPIFQGNESQGQRSRRWADRNTPIELTARAVISDADFAYASQLRILHPLGGERRLVHWQSDQNHDRELWACPPPVKEALTAATRVRLVLATPAIFTRGWRPGWLDDELEGEWHGVRLKLVGVNNGRWKAVSGWSMARINNQGQLDRNGKPGPKPVRRMVPAGSVYFFQVTGGSPKTLADNWLQSVSDDEQEQRDGFGLSVWGTW